MAAAGRRPATIYAVAERAGVSIATVSRVLQGSGATSERSREKVLRAARSLEYVPQTAARSLTTRRYDAHGLVLGAMTGPFWTELLVGYEAAVSARGASLVLLVAASSEAATLEDVAHDPESALLRLAARVDGLAIADHDLDASLVARLAAQRPVVLISRDPAPEADTVVTENVRSATELTSHLIEHGRRRIAFVGDPDGSRDVADRYAGFRAAHRSAGRRAPAARYPVEQTEQSGSAVADRLATRVLAARSGGPVGPDALVCANDELALALIARLVERGVDVPGEVAVVGWDDVPAARYISPGLTTVRQPVADLGRIAADRLHARIAGAPPWTEERVLPTELVLRGSCGFR